MRIAQVAPLWTAVPPKTYGSIELLVYLLVEELVRRGHEVTLFASGDSKTSGVLRPICEHNMIDRMAEGNAFEYDYYSNACMTAALREKDAFDVIHSHLGFSKIPFGALSETPVIHTVHTALSPDDQWVLAKFPEARVVSVSKNQVAAVPAGRRKNMHVIHNGCDFGGYALSQTPGKYLVFLGRMSLEKNPVDAIRLAQAANLPIVLAGKPQTRKEEQFFQQEVKPLIDDKAVRYVGAVDFAQKRELLRNASAFVFPTNWPEPFAVAPLEALACGLPVLAFNNGSVAEAIDYGVTGFYGKSVEELAPLVPAALALDRAAIREHALKRFSHQRMVDEYETLFRCILAR